jgi:biotin carboxylase
VSPGSGQRAGTSLGEGQVVLVGYSRILVAALESVMPPSSLVVLEEPDVAAKRDLLTLADRQAVVSRLLVTPYQDTSTVAGLLSAQPRLEAARAVLPGSEYAVEAAAELAAALGLPGAGPAAAAIFRNKARQRRAAAVAGLRNPAYQIVDTVDAAIAFFDRVQSRCVLKPTARQASLGVRIVTTREEIRDGFRAAIEADEPLLVPERGIASEVMIEEAVTGAEYSVEMLVAGGCPVFSNVTAKQVLPGRYPVELGHVVPGGPSAGLTRDLVRCTTRLAAASGFGTGILHAEWIVDDGGPVLVECAARMPGDEIATLVSLAYDMPLVRAYLDVMLGCDTTEMPAEPRYGAAIRFLTAAPGTVTEVTGAREAGAAPGLHAIHVAAQPGGLVRTVTSSWDRLGYVICRGASGPQAQALAARAAGAISILTEEPAGSPA